MPDVRVASFTAQLALVLGVSVVAACAKKAPEQAPVAVVTSAAGDRTHCTEVRARYTQYPKLPVEQEPSRLSGAFPRIAPARRDLAFTVSFVVDTTGKPVISTYTVSKHVGAKFTTELRKSVVGWRYTPASVEGCLVSRRVSHTIDTGVKR